MWIISTGDQRGRGLEVAGEWLLFHRSQPEAQHTPPPSSPPFLLLEDVTWRMWRGRTPTRSTFQGLIKKWHLRATVFGVWGRPVWNPVPASWWRIRTLEALFHETLLCGTAWERFSVSKSLPLMWRNAHLQASTHTPRMHFPTCWGHIQVCSFIIPLKTLRLKVRQSGSGWPRFYPWCLQYPAAFLAPPFTWLSAPQMCRVLFGIPSSSSCPSPPHFKLLFILALLSC